MLAPARYSGRKIGGIPFMSLYNRYPRTAERLSRNGEVVEASEAKSSIL